MKKIIKAQNNAPEELLLLAILDFYRKHRDYRISQNEFASLVCVLSQQFLHDV